MSRILSTRPCEGCGEPSERDVRDKRCDSCDRRHHTARTKAWRLSPRGQVFYRNRHRQPKWKIASAAYAERNRDKMREYGRRWRAKHYVYRTGQVLPCATLGCKGTFVRTRFNGSQKFGDDCDCRKLSIEYSTQVSRTQYERRGRRPLRRAA